MENYRVSPFLKDTLSLLLVYIPSFARILSIKSQLNSLSTTICLNINFFLTKEFVSIQESYYFKLPLFVYMTVKNFYLYVKAYKKCRLNVYYILQKLLNPGNKLYNFVPFCFLGECLEIQLLQLN